MPEAKKEKTKHKSEELKFSGLYRSETNKVIAGVAGGLGEYFNFDATIIRIIFILMTVFGGSGLIIYLILWLIIPAKSSISKNSQDTIRDNIEDMKSKTRTFAHDIGGPGAVGNNSKFWWAVLIIVLGFFFLMKNYGLLEPFDFDKLWPLLLVIVGLAIILRKK